MQTTLIMTKTRTETAVSTADPTPAITIVVPTRNEAENVAPLLQRLARALAGVSVEVLFVDDSTDETPAVVRQMNGRFPFPVRLIARPPERRNGLSGAVVEGFQAAQGKWVCVIDGDLQHPPETVAEMYDRADETGADMVVGSRRADLLGPRGLSRFRSLTSQLLTIMARAIFPRLLKNVSDPLTGLFLVRRSLVDPTLLQPEGFKILLEILVRCPDMHVSEVHFEFASRHAGESKADFREGMRFFHHLVRLRLTADSQFPRFLAVGGVGLIVNNVLLVLLVAGFSWHFLLAAVAATEFTTLWNFFWTEGWVYRERREGNVGRRLLRFFLMNQVFLFLVRFPIMNTLVVQWAVNYVVANLLSILVTSFVRYVLSEQWIWSRDLIVWQRADYYYDIHGIIGLASPVQLPELAYFETADTPGHIDIQVRVDRHGTPTCPPGAICFSEQVSRFGFGLAIMPGDCTEIVVSPALQKAPYALYKSVLEPALRWTFVRKGYALVYGACAAREGQAVLVTPRTDMGKTTTALRTVARPDWSFLSDDLTILDGNGRVWSYPKPVTLMPHMLPAIPEADLSAQERRSLRWRNLLFSRRNRERGLRFSRRQWPVATLNIYAQRLLAPPKYMVDRLAPGTPIADVATLSYFVLIEQGTAVSQPMSREEAVDLLCQKRGAVNGFPPYAFLMEQLSQWEGRDLRAEEQAIIKAALGHCQAHRLRRPDFGWWRDLPALLAPVGTGA